MIILDRQRPQIEILVDTSLVGDGEGGGGGGGSGGGSGGDGEVGDGGVGGEGSSEEDRNSSVDGDDVDKLVDIDTGGVGDETL